MPEEISPADIAATRDELLIALADAIWDCEQAMRAEESQRWLGGRLLFGELREEYISLAGRVARWPAPPRLDCR